MSNESDSKNGTAPPDGIIFKTQQIPVRGFLLLEIFCCITFLQFHNTSVFWNLISLKADQLREEKTSFNKKNVKCC